MLLARKEKGVSLLEILLVLLIAAIFIIISVRFYKNYQKTRDIGIFQTRVSQLMNALNNYYYMYCWQVDYDIRDASIQRLQQVGLIESNVNTWKDFSVNINNLNVDDPNKPEADFYVLKVTATVNDPQLADHLRSALNGDIKDINKPTEVVWTRLPLYSRDDLSSYQWIFNQGPGQIYMPGRYTTAVNTGTGSKFWILNSNLQSFTKGSPKVPNVQYKVCPN